MVANHQALYFEVVVITKKYLGPAAERFISRQVQNHLHKEPMELTREDLTILIDWVRVAIAMVTEDVDVIEEYVAQLTKLAKEPRTAGKHA